MRKFLKSSIAAALTLAGVAGAPSVAHAYNATSHQQIVDAAWQLMAASQDPALTTGRGLFDDRSTLPRSLRTAPDGISQAEWDTFLAAIRNALLAFNRMPAGLSSASGSACAKIAPLAPLGRIDATIGVDYRGPTQLFRGDENTGDNCHVIDELPHGIFSKIGMGGPTGLGGEFGSTLGQGLALGWHSKAGDDCGEDIVLGSNLAQVLANFPIPALGGLSLNQAAQIVLLAAAAPVLCFVAIFSGENCLDQANSFAHSANPVTALAGLLPPLDLDVTDNSTFGGLPHFIHIEGDAGQPRNYFDDRRGMWYEGSGPYTFPGAFDLGIMVLAEKSGAVLDHDPGSDDKHALAIDRYDLGAGVGDHHPEERHKRSGWEWNRETLGHTQMTPLDNFAYFGWKQFREDPQHSVKFLRWPLHAIGDATVPMHVTTTTGWGHRAYEDAFNQKLASLRLLDASNTAQLAQAHGILAQAYEVRQFILDWRARHGETTDVPMRDLVTRLAKDTLDSVEALSELHPNTDWYCDSCSIGYLANEAGATSHYTDDAHVDNMRVLYRKAVAYSLAFLVSAGETPLTAPICVEAGSGCSVDSDCCVGSCDSGQCVTPPTSGPHSCSATAPCPHGPCVNGFCEGGTECTNNSQCGLGACENGYCDNSCTKDDDCAGGGCSGGTCCAAETRECAGNQECCSGVCTEGTCRKTQGSPGEACSQNDDCVRGRCEADVCVVDCSSEQDCNSNSSCRSETCCVALNSRCNLSTDCCGFSRCASGFCRPEQVE